MAIDAGGVVAAHIASRRDETYLILLRFLADDALVGPVRAVADTLGPIATPGLRGASLNLTTWRI
jgi:hypothetical protein